MRQKLLWTAIALALLGSAAFLIACNRAKADVGPNGGDVVAVPNTTAKAEVIGNADTGEVVVRTWDERLKEARPLADERLVVGAGDRRLELQPHPMADDPPGRASRFYGRAEWLRGGTVDRAWIECCGGESSRGDFAWRRGWDAGRQHGEMWREMREHGEGMGEHGMSMGIGMGNATATSTTPSSVPPSAGGEGEHPMPGGSPHEGMDHMPAGPMGVPPSPASTPTGNAGGPPTGSGN